MLYISWRKTGGEMIEALRQVQPPDTHATPYTARYIIGTV